MKKELSPSILSADFYNLENDLTILKKNDIKYLHIDVMDGMFVPNISFGIPVIKKIKEHTKNDFILDTHLMIEKPERYVKAFKEAGADILTIHVETTDKIYEIIGAIKKEGMKVGVTLKPDTDIKKIDELLKDVDIVLVMSVNPGFGGQNFMEESLMKVQYLKEKKEKNNYKYMIEIDGGVNIDNAKKILDAGVDILVAGSAVFNGNIIDNINKFKEVLWQKR